MMEVAEPEALNDEAQEILGPLLLNLTARLLPLVSGPSAAQGSNPLPPTPMTKQKEAEAEPSLPLTVLKK